MGEKYSLPTPERKYYSFDGWYTDKNGGTKVTSSDVMSTGERHTLYAHWTVKSVTVTYDAGSGNVTGDTNVKYNLGTEYGKNWQRELVTHLWAGILKQMEVVQKFLKLI